LSRTTTELLGWDHQALQMTQIFGFGPMTTARFGSAGYRCCCPGRSIAVPSSLVEHEFTCPYCGEEISMVLDLSVDRQAYVEDCEVCCKPIEISFTIEDGELASFDAKTLG